MLLLLLLSLFCCCKDNGGVGGNGGDTQGKGGSGFFLSEGDVRAGTESVAFAGAAGDNCEEEEEEEEVIHVRRNVAMCRQGRPLPLATPPLSSGEGKSYHAFNGSGSRSGSYAFAAEEDEAPVVGERRTSGGRSNSSRGSCGTRRSTICGEQNESWPLSPDERELLAIWVSNNDSSLHGDSSPDVPQRERRGAEYTASSLPRMPLEGGGRAMEIDGLMPAGGGAGAAAEAAEVLINSPPRPMRYRMTPDGSLVLSDAGRATIPRREKRNHRRQNRKSDSDERVHHDSRTASAILTTAGSATASCDTSDDDDDAINTLRVAQHKGEEEQEEEEQQEEQRQRQLWANNRHHHDQSIPGRGEDCCRGTRARSSFTMGVTSGRRKANRERRAKMRSSSFSSGVSGGRVGSEFFGKLKHMLEMMPKTPRTPAVKRRTSRCVRGMGGMGWFLSPMQAVIYERCVQECERSVGRFTVPIPTITRS